MKNKSFAIGIEIDGQKPVYITPRNKDAGFVLRIRMRNSYDIVEHTASIKIYCEVAENGIVRLGVVTPLEGFDRDNVGNLVKSGWTHEEVQS